MKLIKILEQKIKLILFNFLIEFIIILNLLVFNLFLVFFSFFLLKINLEPSSTFIISPMIERTLFQLTQAIFAYRIGVIHAPSQYGRSMVIQILSQV
jgi:hypothetical protein